MSENHFFPLHVRLSATSIADECGGNLLTSQFADRQVNGLSSLENARAGTLVFVDGSGKDDLLSALRESVLLCTEKHAALAHHSMAVIVVEKPQQAFAKIGRLLFPSSVKASGYATVGAFNSSAYVSDTALCENDVVLEPCAIVGAGAEIGSGTLISAGAVIGDGVKIGRNCVVGPSATVTHALVGNEVIIHAGARIGQDGFGYVPGLNGLEKMPQLGRVIIQDKVEIGANTTIDRGAIDDTIIGEGTKIDNLVQIAHNCRIGRYCVITGHCGLSGSVTLGDRVMLGGRVGIADHVIIGDGAQIAAASGVMNNVGPGERWAGLPAQPIKEFFREVAIIRGLVRGKREKAK